MATENGFMSAAFRFSGLRVALIAAITFFATLILGLACAMDAFADSSRVGDVYYADRLEPFPVLSYYRPYEDLTGSEWFFEAANVCKQTGLLGADDEIFAADSEMTFAECNDIVLKLRKGFYGVDITGLTPEYALNKAYIPDNPINRESFADMLTTVIKDTELTVINDINAVPGSRYLYEYDTVDMGDRLLKLYRAGILVGDEHGYFSPLRPLTRAEAVAIVYRIIRSEARLRLDSDSFIADPDKRISRVRFDDDTLDMIAKANYSFYFTGDAFVLSEMSTDSAYNKHAVYSLNGDIVMPFVELYIYTAEYRLNLQDGMTRYIDDDGVYHFYSNESGEVSTGNQIIEATPYNDGYAAVRFRDTKDTDVYVIDKSGKIVSSIPTNLSYELNSIRPKEGVILGWANNKDPSLYYDDYQPWDITSNVMISIETGKVINFEGLAAISEEDFFGGFIPAIKNAALEDDALAVRQRVYDFVDSNGRWLGFSEKGYDRCVSICEKYLLVSDKNQDKIVDFGLNDISFDDRMTSDVSFVNPNDPVLEYLATDNFEGRTVVQHIVKNIDTGGIISIDSSSRRRSYYRGYYSWIDHSPVTKTQVLIDVYGNALLSLPDTADILFPYNARDGANFVYEDNGEYYHFEYTGKLPWQKLLPIVINRISYMKKRAY